MSDQDWPPGPAESGEGPPPPPGAPPPPPGAGAHQPAAAGAGTAADLTTRFLGRLIDWVLLFIVSAIISAVFIAIAVAGGGGRMSGAFGGGFSVVSILVSLVPGAYFIGMLAYNGGRTVGKMLVGLQVRSADASPLDVSKAFQREWWNLLLVVPFFLGNLATAGMAIFIAVSINNGRPWHDQQAGTYEIKTK